MGEGEGVVGRKSENFGNSETKKMIPTSHKQKTKRKTKKVN